MTLSEDSSLVCADLDTSVSRQSRSHETHLVGRVTVLDHAVRTDDNGVDTVMLEQRTNHSVA